MNRNCKKQKNKNIVVYKSIKVLNASRLRERKRATRFIIHYMEWLFIWDPIFINRSWQARALCSPTSNRGRGRNLQLHPERNQLRQVRQDPCRGHRRRLSPVYPQLWWGRSGWCLPGQCKESQVWEANARPEVCHSYNHGREGSHGLCTDWIWQNGRLAQIMLNVDLLFYLFLKFCIIKWTIEHTCMYIVEQFVFMVHFVFVTLVMNNCWHYILYWQAPDKLISSIMSFSPSIKSCVQHNYYGVLFVLISASSLYICL